jgi:hypothetical protein
VQHCEQGFKRATLGPITEVGTVPDWYKGKARKVEREETTLRAESSLEGLKLLNISSESSH